MALYKATELRNLRARVADLKSLLAAADTPRERERWRETLERVERKIARILRERAARRQQRAAEIAEQRREAESARRAQQEAAETEARQAEQLRENDAWMRRNFPAADAPRRVQRPRKPESEVIEGPMGPVRMDQ
jgi:agmatine/peptidylarginine deiminase